MMTAADLRPEQRAAVADRLQPTTGCLIRLAKRMQQLGFHPDDPTLAAVWKAQEAIVDVRMKFTYAGTISAWEPPK
jgi:hypothetical protein